MNEAIEIFNFEIYIQTMCSCQGIFNKILPKIDDLKNFKEDDL